MDNLLDIEIVIDTPQPSYDLQQGVSGKVIVRPQIDAVVDFLGIGLQYKQRGKLSAVDSKPQIIQSNRNLIWKIGQTYEYFFRNIRPNIPTYQGKNAKINWYITTPLRFSEQTRSQLQKQHLKKFRLLKSINPEREFQQELPLIFTDKRPLIVPVQRGFLKFRNEYWSIYSLVFGMISLTLFFVKFVWYYYAIALAILGIVLLIQMNLTRMLFGKIKIEIPQAKDDFQCKLQLNSGVDLIKDIKTAIQVVEISSSN